MTATMLETTPADAPAEEGGRSRKKLLIIVGVLVLLLGGAGYYFFFMGASGKGHKHAPPQPGQIVALDHITVNLAGGHYLRIGLALQLAKGKSLGSDAAADPAAAGAQAYDETITVFGGQSVSALTRNGREKLKSVLLRRLQGDYDGAVIGVYFTEFVMQ